MTYRVLACTTAATALSTCASSSQASHRSSSRTAAAYRPLGGPSRHDPPSSAADPSPPSSANNSCKHRSTIHTRRHSLTHQPHLIANAWRVPRHPQPCLARCLQPPSTQRLHHRRPGRPQGRCQVGVQTQPLGAPPGQRLAHGCLQGGQRLEGLGQGVTQGAREDAGFQCRPLPPEDASQWQDCTSRINQEWPKCANGRCAKGAHTATGA